MEENRFHYSVEVKNCEEVCIKIQQIKQLIDELNDIELNLDIVPNEIKNIEETAKRIGDKNMKTEIKQEENDIAISASNEEIKMDDLVQSAINYLYDRFKNIGYISDYDVELFKLLYKD